MKLKHRLALMFLSFFTVIAIGYRHTGSLDFAVNDFWFIAGALLLILITLVDQPHFSKDANVFNNASAAWVSLFTVPLAQRTGVWWFFFFGTAYLIASSFTLMWLRTRELFAETAPIQFFSRLNRAIGRPEALFSVFFLWGVFIQFDYPRDGEIINSLLLFWAIFMIANMPAVAEAIDRFLTSHQVKLVPSGIILGIRSPRLAEVLLSSELPESIVGRKLSLRLNRSVLLADGVLVEDRSLKGRRIGLIALSKFHDNWRKVSENMAIRIEVLGPDGSEVKPVGVVSPGSSIGSLVFEVDPRTIMSEGQIVSVAVGEKISYYQVISATISEKDMGEDNCAQSVRVIAGQLGIWIKSKQTFEPIDWVAPAGGVVESSVGNSAVSEQPKGHCRVGKIPGSDFPIHVHIEDAVTHNTALIGVTGSGKSYLAFHLIEAYLAAGIKVLILDPTREHWGYLVAKNPTPIAMEAEIESWLNSASLLGVYQFANAASLPKNTADFVEKCFNWLKGTTTLKAGVDLQAKLCIVMEEAHSLVPEWNQVAVEADKGHVNRTARVVLQGRKFGLGTLLITQRTANVTKTILNQCNTIFALRSFDQTGLDFLRNYMGEEYSQAISTLPNHTAILVGKASSSTRPVLLKISDFKGRWNTPAPAPPPTAAAAAHAAPLPASTPSGTPPLTSGE